MCIKVSLFAYCDLNSSKHHLIMTKDLDQRVSELSSNGYSFNIGNYISEGFSIFGQYAGGFIGFILLQFVISGVLGVIPIVGSIASWVIMPALQAGVFIVADRIRRREAFRFENFFDGFKANWLQLFLVNLFSGLIILLLLAPLAPSLYAFIQAYQEFVASGGSESPEIMLSELPAWAGTYLLVVSPIMVYLGISWGLAQMNVIFYNATAWEAMEASRKVVHRRWWMWFIFVFVCGIVAILGVIGLVIGLLITFPAVMCAMYAAYADVMQPDNDDKMDDASHFVA